MNEVERLIAELNAGLPTPKTDDDSLRDATASGSRKPGVGARSQTNRRNQQKFLGRPLGDVTDPFGSIDMTDQEAIAEAQANDIELNVDPERVAAGIREDERKLQQDLTKQLDAIDVEIQGVEQDTLGFPIGVTAEERVQYEESREGKRQQLSELKNKRAELKSQLAQLGESMKQDSEVSAVDEQPASQPREMSPVYVGRDRFAQDAAVRRAETGERTLSRFFKDDVVGELSEQRFNLPQGNTATISVDPASSGLTEDEAASGEVVFTDSLDRLRNAEGIVGIPGINMEGSLLELPAAFVQELGSSVLGSALSAMTGGGPVSSRSFRERVFGDTAPRGDGGLMFTPTAPEGRQVNMDRLNKEIESRQDIIEANDDEIKNLQQQIESRPMGARIGDLTGRIALLESDNEQKQAELTQMDRILKANMQ
mgnify:CR=1 FL=1|tara:strand:+ start:664 stop:1941 length:1278 start_codon:yes stop_codon:yes gene_type:complete